MGSGIIITVVKALVDGVPRLIEAIKAGRNPEDIKLGDFISTDAVNTIKGAIKEAQDFKNRFPDDPEDS